MTASRIKGAVRAYRFARSFRVGTCKAAALAVRFAFTGKTGRYKLPPQTRS